MQASDSFRTITACRICSSRDLVLVVSLGRTPLANAFVRPERVADPEPRYPLEALRCRACGLVQLSVVVRPELMFSSYLYASSSSAPMLGHFDGYAEDLTSRFLAPGSLVVEIGSNDGALLASLAARGVRALGIEPASNIAVLATAAGRETLNEFFSLDLARRIVAERGHASAVVGNNVFAHIDDLSGTLAGLDALLGPDGVFVLEVPYLGDLLERVEYDTIYHEHLSYFSLGPLVTLFSSVGMEPFDVRHLSIHGGSIRMYVGRAGKRPVTPGLQAMLAAERTSGRFGEEGYASFAQRVRASRDALRAMLGRLRADGSRIAGHGASAKGNTLLNYCEIGADTIEFIGDTTPLKQGLLAPGSHIPVRPEEDLTRLRPDYTLLLAWNYADAIVSKHSGYVGSGGRFIHPIPLARLYGAAA